MAIIPAATPRKARTPFLVSPPAHTIQRLVGFHFKPTSPATSTRPSAPRRFFQALQNNTTVNANTAYGANALLGDSTGGGNTAIGNGALFKNTTGDSNTALGISAGSGVTTGTNVICIGSDGANVNNSCFIGNIHGVTTAINDAIPVVIDSAGQLGTMSSSYRFKKDIATMEKSSEAVLSLRPVTFHYRTDTKSTPQFGLIAEEVAKVNPDLVVRDKKGEIYTVRYDA